MTHRNDVVTKGYVRKVAVWGAALICLLVLGLQFKGSVDQTLSLQAGCERANIQREALYRNTLSDARTRHAAVDQFHGEARREIRRQARTGFRDAQALVDTYASVAEEPGSVRQDCDTVYSLPFPLG